MTKLLTLSILFSTTVRALVVAKLVILGISPLTLSILALREELVIKLAKLGISLLTYFTFNEWFLYEMHHWAETS